ncbi:MAG: aspartate aminotransferase family protein, partial [Gammaproteobacteria bacterium]
TLDVVSRPGFFLDLGKKTEALVRGLRDAAEESAIPLSTNFVGGMFGIFFSQDDPITRFEQVLACNQDRFRKFFHSMLESGVYLAPSPFEAGFVSAAHGTDDIERTLAAARKAFARLKD